MMMAISVGEGECEGRPRTQGEQRMGTSQVLLALLPPLPTNPVVGYDEDGDGANDHFIHLNGRADAKQH